MNITFRFEKSDANILRLEMKRRFFVIFLFCLYIDEFDVLMTPWLNQ